eukprot:CAMPEP_0176429638 /NCGR_PEP_ID=MMETSP0127-20121128/13820_1 /TAXON_ID=938130 /ORGANISM="Platyophrya macrostoma, Strain WH" /LENGTH=88 /DNA_ID=CAMNT_0017811461 /DNA_START=243 /DNA_END=509 /DNA_ORIENTATION=+
MREVVIVAHVVSMHASRQIDTIVACQSGKSSESAAEVISSGLDVVKDIGGIGSGRSLRVGSERIIGVDLVQHPSSVISSEIGNVHHVI